MVIKTFKIIQLPEIHTLTSKVLRFSRYLCAYLSVELSNSEIFLPGKNFALTFSLLTMHIIGWCVSVTCLEPNNNDTLPIVLHHLERKNRCWTKLLKVTYSLSTRSLYKPIRNWNKEKISSFHVCDVFLIKKKKKSGYDRWSLLNFSNDLSS